MPFHHATRCVSSLLMLLALLGIVGCGDSPGPSPNPGPELQCADGIPTIGVAGESVTEVYPLTWDEEGIATVDLRVPDDLTALAVVADDDDQYTAFVGIRQQGRQYVNLRSDPRGTDAPFFHTWNLAAALTFPVNEDTSLAPGCVRIRAVSERGTVPGTLHVSSRRTAPGGTLRIDLVLVGDTTLPGVTMEEVVDEVSALLGELGLAVAVDVGVATVAGNEFPAVDDEGTYALRASYVPEDPTRIPVYLIQGFQDELDVLGFAGGIPGPNGVPGTPTAGVIVAVDAHLGEFDEVSVMLMAETVVHELGHQLGLFHTTESDGGLFDPIADTPECRPAFDQDDDGELSAEECEDIDGRNVMFWVSGSFRQRELSEWQRRVIELAPVAR